MSEKSPGWGYKDCPCRGCQRREIGCHGKCEEYQTWSREKTKEREELREERRAHYTMNDDTLKQRYREIKRRGRYGLHRR